MSGSNETFKYELGLVDNITAPAKKVSKTIGDLGTSVGKLGQTEANPKIDVDTKNAIKSTGFLTDKVASFFQFASQKLTIGVDAKTPKLADPTLPPSAGKRAAQEVVSNISNTFKSGMEKTSEIVSATFTASFSKITPALNTALSKIQPHFRFAADFLKEINRSTNFTSKLKSALDATETAAKHTFSKIGSAAKSVGSNIVSAFSKVGSTLSSVFTIPLSSVFYLMESGKTLIGLIQKMDFSTITKGLDFTPITSITQTFQKFISTTSPEMNKLRSGIQAVVNTLGMFLKPLNDVKVMKSIFGGVVNVAEQLYNAFLIVATFSIRFFGTMFKEARKAFIPLNTGTNILDDLRKGFDKMKPVAVFLGKTLAVAVMVVQIGISGLYRMVQSAAKSFEAWAQPIAQVSAEIMDLIAPAGETSDLINGIMVAFEGLGSVLGTLVGGTITALLASLKAMIQTFQALYSVIAGLSGQKVNIKAQVDKLEKTKKVEETAKKTAPAKPIEKPNKEAETKKQQEEIRKTSQDAKKSSEDVSKTVSKGNTEIVAVLKEMLTVLQQQGAGLGGSKGAGI